MEKRKLFDSIGYLYLSIAWLACISCLIRSDFNFAFALVCYYLWISKDDALNSKILIIVTLILSIFDFIWLVSIGSIWCEWLSNNTSWNREHALHVFVIITSVFELVLKLLACGMIYIYREKQTSLENVGLKSDPGNPIGYRSDQI